MHNWKSLLKRLLFWWAILVGAWVGVLFLKTHACEAMKALRGLGIISFILPLELWLLVQWGETAEGWGKAAAVGLLLLALPAAWITEQQWLNEKVPKSVREICPIYSLPRQVRAATAGIASIETALMLAVGACAVASGSKTPDPF